jgi:SAM-dependent methyltransferase
MSQNDKMSIIFKIFRFIYQNAVESPFHRQHVRLLEREIIGSCQSVLDIGCGAGTHMREIAPYLKYSVGIDVFPPILERARDIYSETRVLDATDVRHAFDNNSFDCVVAFDLLEHLEKHEGYRLLDEMERIATKKVIVFTPNGFLPQEPLDGNEYQIHRSGWSVSEMRLRNYRVSGVHGIKTILGQRSKPRWKPYHFWLAASVFTQPFCTVAPKLAFQIFCVKDI